MPFISLTEKYKCSKVRLQLTLNDSKDQTISKAAPPQSAGQKWTPTNTEQKATSTESRRHGGACPAGTKRLWPGGRQPTWHTVTTSECRILVAEEGHQQEETARSAKAGSLAKWEQWMGGGKLWEMEANNISFVIKATYDMLPSPTNPKQWFGEDPTCAPCPTTATVKHIKTWSESSLTQGHYTWQHNQVLKSLALAHVNKLQPTPCPQGQPIHWGQQHLFVNKCLLDFSLILHDLYNISSSATMDLNKATTKL